MALEGNELLLFQMVKNQLGENISMKEVRATVSGVAAILKLDQHSVDVVLDEFRTILPPVPSSDFYPRLFVDWGDMPRVGVQCRPEFTLICPGYASKPDIRVTIDRELDHDASDCYVRAKTEDIGLWSFHVPFRMTSQGLDCRPGYYLLEVQIAFREVPSCIPRFFRVGIRLHAPSVPDSKGGVLEIDGDGQSIVNIQGCDLRQFAKVVLKAGQDGVINLASAQGSSLDMPSSCPEKATTTYEYKLKIDYQKQERVPKLFFSRRPCAHLDAAGFYFEDGRRAMIFARPKITLGRSRDNDVVIRFLPRSEENDRHSGNISRTHLIAELTPNGVEIQDESRSGVEVNYSVVRGRHVISSIFVGEAVHIDLGVTGTVPKKFEMEMSLFGPDRTEHSDELEYWDDLVCEIAGGKLARIARMALETGINAIRYDRLTSLRDEESYVQLFREVLVGGSPAKCGVLLKESGSHPLARLVHIDRMFWMESLPGSLDITIDGEVLPARSIAPLVPGMEVQFGHERLRFDRALQFYLD
jgi:hypothetical protein